MFKIKTLAVVLLLLLSGCGDKILTEQEYVEKAKVSLDKGDYRESIIHLKNALANYPDSAESRFLLGDIYVRAGNSEGAEKELNRAFELGVIEEAIIEKLAGALLMQGDAEKLIQRFGLKDDDSLVVKGQKLVALGDAYFQQRKFENAESSYDDAMLIATAKTRAQLGMARLNIVKKDNKLAIELVTEALKERPNSSEAWLTRADVYRAVGNTNETLLSYENAALNTNSPQDYYYFVALKGQIEQHLQQNATAKAEQILQALSDAFYNGEFPDIPVLNHLRAIISFQNKQYDEALFLAGKVVAITPNHYGAILILGAINAVNGNYEQAENYLQRFLLVSPRHIGTRKILAYVQLKKNAVKSATETLKPLENIEELDAETLALVASASLRAGDAVKGAKFYKKALSEEPDSSVFRRGLAQSYVGMEEYEKALNELGQVRDKSSDKPRASLAIVETQIKAKNYAAALSELDNLEQLARDNPLYSSLRGTVYLLKNERDQATQEFKKALNIKPGFPPAGRNLAFLAMQRQDVSGAENYLNEILKENPKHVATIYDYARLKMKSKSYSEAEALIKSVSLLDKNKVRNIVLLARLYLQEQKPSNALAELRTVQTDGLEANAAVFAEQGNAQMMLGEYINARDSYQKLLAIETGSEIAHYLLYTAHLALRNKTSASNALKDALALNNEFVLALIGKVGMLFSDKQFVEAEQHIRRLKTLAPDNVQVKLLAGELAMSQGLSAKAIKLYETLYEEIPTVNVAQRLAQAHWAVGDKSQALVVLADASKKQPDNAHLNYVLATAYQGMEEEQKAIEFYEKAIQLNEHHVLALNNLAWLLKDSETNVALAYAKKAFELAPQNESIKDTLNQLQKRVD